MKTGIVAGLVAGMILGLLGLAYVSGWREGFSQPCYGPGLDTVDPDYPLILPA